MLLKLTAGGLLMLIAGLALSSEDATTRALRLYERRHYEEAEQLLRPAMPGMEAGQRAAASLALGMNYLASAELYQALFRSALLIEEDYLKLLAKQRTGKPSRYVELYLGQVLSESGRSGEAVKHFRKFAGLEGVPAEAGSAVRAEIAADLVRKGQVQRALHELAGMSEGNDATRSALAGVYAMAAAKEMKPEDIADAVQRTLKVAGKHPERRVLRNLLRVYAYSGSMGKALDLLQGADLGEASIVEELGNSKSISFYDTSLFDDLYRVHVAAAEMYLKQAANDTGLAGTAAYYLAVANLLQGRGEAAQEYFARTLESGKLPPAIRVMAQAGQARAQYMAGRKADAAAAWTSLQAGRQEDPVLMSVILNACTDAHADCGKLEKPALVLAEKGEGKRFFPLYSALGRYYLRERKYAQAFQYLEAGRDKSYKNKIEANDPLMMVSLAEACYRNRKFSENLEIYFELGKQFPVVRQIQDAMQGIYAMEHRSAGEVKIF